MNYYISKRARDDESAFKQWISTVWKTNQGPLQNLFRFLPYATIPLIGMSSIIPMTIITVATHILKISPEDLGKEADRALGLRPGDDPRDILPAVVNYFDSIFEKEANASCLDKPISKNASLVSGLLRVFGFGKIVAKFITTIIAMLASVFVFSHLGEFIKKLTEPFGEKITETTGWSGVENIGIRDEKKPTEKNVEEFADYIEQKYGLQ